MNLSTHFTDSEFACKHCGKKRRVPAALLKALELARSRHYPKGLVIHSGYRCWTHNRAVGGKLLSRHLVGDAVDIDPAMTEAQARACGFTGVGLDVHGKAVHVDMGPSRTWHYDANGNTP